MGRKRDKGKEKQPKEDSTSPTKALSEHSDDLGKTLNTPPTQSKDLKKWIEELSQSLEVLKALQNIASSSAEDTGMSSKSKAIVSAHDTAIPSQKLSTSSNPIVKPSSSKAIDTSSTSKTSKSLPKGKKKINWASLSSFSDSNSSHDDSDEESIKSTMKIKSKASSQKAKAKKDKLKQKGKQPKQVKEKVKKKKQDSSLSSSSTSSSDTL
ncbi:hypothetical protein JCGZ_10382 [Jatropha curcas]|uniref:Uncharacterized protein n=1 Tax=Jatropha curcas TaxID=180498 RepID=A0A067KK71_JATCU|nr:hypothetical protein JCGZ_10382 [Jatropha curcas]